MQSLRNKTYNTSPQRSKSRRTSTTFRTFPSNNSYNSNSSRCLLNLRKPSKLNQKMKVLLTINSAAIILSTLGNSLYRDNFVTVYLYREVIINRYVIIEKVGWGHFSTVWLCKDLKYNTYVALKIQKSAPHYLEAAYDEVEIL